MATYLFVDTATNRVTRVSAADEDQAWVKFIDRWLSIRPYLLREGPLTSYSDRREELENDIFVVDESTEVIEI